MVAQGPGAPDPDATAGKGSQAVDTLGIEIRLVGVGELPLEIHHAFQDFVRRRLVHARPPVRPRVDAGHVTARRHEQIPALKPTYLDPGIIESAIFSVDAPPLLPDSLGGIAGPRIQNGETIPNASQLWVLSRVGGPVRSLAMVHEGLLQLEYCLLVFGEVRRADQVDGVQMNLGFTSTSGGCFSPPFAGSIGICGTWFLSLTMGSCGRASSGSSTPISPTSLQRGAQRPHAR